MKNIFLLLYICTFGYILFNLMGLILGKYNCPAVGVSWLYSTEYICAGAFYRVCSVAHQYYHYGNDPILPFSLWP